MAEFWLATFEAAALYEDGEAAEAGALVLEIIRDGDDYAVLLSTTKKVDEPQVLQCLIAFANVAKAASVWRDRGFPLNDAFIERSAEGKLVVDCPCFRQPSAIEYGARVIEIQGATLADPKGQPVKSPFEAKYEQLQQAPDYVFPATYVRRKKVEWTPTRSKVISLPPGQLTLGVPQSRFPNLTLKGGTVTPNAVWHGTIELPAWRAPDSRAPEERVDRINEFGPPAFQFEAVEVLGFRLNLDELGVRNDALLSEMIDRLNYHLQTSTPDFHYQPATRTLMLEMLRYGKMKGKGSAPPLRDDDYQSQHELLVRLLVGRVDDDTAQARDPATYVPAIFVDNPWSKLIGRNVQGFDKWMADFCVRDSDGVTPLPLLPDGRLTKEASPRALADIRQVNLVTRTGKGPSGPKLLELDCPYTTFEHWDDFSPIDLDLALGMSALAPTRWRQDDFDDMEFRRSFARSAIPGTLKGFESIQVSPVGETNFLKAWKDQTTLIRGTFTVEDDPQIVMPNGTVTLTLFADPMAPKAWKSLCRLLGGREGDNGVSISLTTGNWYRMRCSMNLTIRNSFE